MFLLSGPKGAHVSDVFVQTSTRKQELALDIELAGVEQSGPVELLARVLDEHGQEERRFTAQTKVKAADTQVIRTAWHWPDPRLWDLGRPNLYTLMLEVRGAGLDDTYAQRFGFREFWIEGTHFFLNGTEFRPGPRARHVQWAFAADGPSVACCVRHQSGTE